MATDSGTPVDESPVDDGALNTADSGADDVLQPDDDIQSGGDQATEPVDATASTSADTGDATSPASTPAPATADWRAPLEQQFGVRLNVYERPELALENALHAASQLAVRQREYEQRLQESQRQLSELAQFRAQAEAERARQEAEAKKPKRQVPEWNPEFEALLTTDENGNVVARPGADPTLPAKYIAHRRWQAQEQQRFFNDPAAYFAETVLPGIKEQFDNSVKEQISTAFERQQAENAARQMTQEIENWAFARNPDGSLVRGPNGQAVPTYAGQLYLQSVQALTDSGRPDHIAHQFAKNATLVPILQDQVAQLQQQLAQLTGNQAGIAQAGVPAANAANQARSKQQQQAEHLRSANQPVRSRGNRAGGLSRVDRPVMSSAEIRADTAKRLQALGSISDDELMIRRN